MLGWGGVGLQPPGAAIKWCVLGIPQKPACHGAGCREAAGSWVGDPPSLNFFFFLLEGKKLSLPPLWLGLGGSPEKLEGRVRLKLRAWCLASWRWLQVGDSRSFLWLGRGGLESGHKSTSACHTGVSSAAFFRSSAVRGDSWVPSAPRILRRTFWLVLFHSE